MPDSFPGADPLGGAPRLSAIVTAGGTAEPIDDVRVVTNLSEGRFGAAIANALRARGVDVTVLGSRAMASHPEWVDPRVRVIPFGSHADLARAIADAAGGAPDLFFMAAAVSDYAPDRSVGKIRSDADELVIHLRRTRKLLAGLRDAMPDTTLIGFKLLSGVHDAELLAVARRQLEQNRLDFTVANDAATFRPGSHPIAILAADGSVERAEGSKARVAEILVDRVLRDRRPMGDLEGLFAEARASVGDRPALHALWDRGVPVGVTAHGPDGVGLWIAPDARGRGLGDRFARQLGEREPRVFGRPEDEGFWAARGFAPDGRVDRWTSWVAPCARTDVMPAASAALVHPGSRSVLLGRRRSGPRAGTWSFPGGSSEPGERPADTARRELREETGLDLPGGLPLSEIPVVVGEGGRAWRVVCVAHAVASRGEPARTAELEARWVSVAEIDPLPLAPGTRTALRQLSSLWEGSWSSG